MIKLPKGYLLHNKYQILNYINSDLIRITYKAINIHNGEIVIIREIFLENICIRRNDYSILSKKQDNLFFHYKQNLLNEVGLLKLLNHPNLVKSFEFIEKNNTIYSVEGYIKNAINLDRYSGDFGNKKAIQFLKDISNGLLAIHNNQTIHRNIKPSNIFYINGKFIISDFTSIKKFKKSNTIFTDIGDKFFSAPEQFKSNSKIGEATDIYAMGAILFTLLTSGKTQDIDKRGSTKHQVLYEKIFINNIKRLEIEDKLKHIILKMLQFDYLKRYQNLKELKIDIDKLNNLYLLKIKVKPIDANIKFIDSQINYNDNLQLEKGKYKIVISKRDFVSQKIEI
jgi:serine/threonine protein kinase